MNAGSAVCAAFSVLAFAGSAAAAEGAPKLSRQDKQDKMAVDAAVIQQVQKCWNPPALQEGRIAKVFVTFALNRDGSIARAPTVVEEKSQWLTPANSAAAIRAINKCAPYTMPAASFEYWREIHINFQDAPIPPADRPAPSLISPQ